ncbi:MAG: hypothetical protein ACD_46C00695G0004 [uncultured bacterium]|nr:MAG: hypothetical protein ACD_46C00695G0004 [uncultured bacterium]
MKLVLKNQPNPYQYKDLLINFANGKPLSCDQLNFLSRHEKALSQHGLDSVLTYYLKNYHHKKSDFHSFLLPFDIINAEEIEKLKKRLKILIATKKSVVKFEMTPEQFLQFKEITHRELFLYHGNQLLANLPFFTGGIPHVVFFKWGNLFGIAKYFIVSIEKALRSNVTIYVEDMEERVIEECIKQYVHEHQEELLAEHKQQLVVQHSPPTQHYSSIYQIPKLTLNINHEQREEN